MTKNLASVLVLTTLPKLQLTIVENRHIDRKILKHFLLLLYNASKSLDFVHFFKLKQNLETRYLPLQLESLASQK